MSVLRSIIDNSPEDTAMIWAAQLGNQEALNRAADLATTWRTAHHQHASAECASRIAYWERVTELLNGTGAP